MTDVALVVVDVGNSRIKVGVFPAAPASLECSQPSEVAAWPHQNGEVVAADAVEFLDRFSPNRVVVGSVAPKAWAAFMPSLPSTWPTAVVATAENFAISAVIPSPAQVGVDRLANATAASKLARGGPCVVIDAGTAITVDIVDADGHFAGGAIFPGFQLAADALTSRTELISPVRVPERFENVSAGRDTTAAIQAGVQLGTVGACQAITARFSQQLSEQCCVDTVPTFVCGGNARLIVETDAVVGQVLQSAEVVDPLTLCGLATVGTS